MRVIKCSLAGFMLVSLGAWSDLSDHSDHDAHQAHQNELHIMQGWVRALPPTQKVTAAYLTLHNAGGDSMVVNRFSSDISDRVELHDSVLKEGQMRMQRLNSLTLSANEHKELAPGGLHLMLMDLASMPREGEKVRVCVASDELESCATLPVLRSAPQAMDAMPHHNHH